MGWLVSVATGSEAFRRVLANMALGTAGAALTVFATNQPFGGGDFIHGEFSAPSVGAAFLGAIAALAIANILRPADTGRKSDPFRRDSASNGRTGIAAPSLFDEEREAQRYRGFSGRSGSDPARF